MSGQILSGFSKIGNTRFAPFYQVIFIELEDRFPIHLYTTEGTVPENFTNAGGIVDLFIDDSHIEELFLGKNLTRDKFTYQISDHIPVWIQVKTDIEGGLSSESNHPG